MFTFNNFRRIALAAMLAFGLTAGAAQAGHYDYGCAPRCGYKVVIKHICKRVPYTKCITLYDHCGRPYTVHKTFYKTIHVPVKKLVKVCY